MPDDNDWIITWPSPPTPNKQSGGNLVRAGPTWQEGQLCISFHSFHLSAGICIEACWVSVRDCETVWIKKLFIDRWFIGFSLGFFLLPYIVFNSFASKTIMHHENWRYRKNPDFSFLVPPKTSDPTFSIIIIVTDYIIKVILLILKSFYVLTYTQPKYEKYLSQASVQGFLSFAYIFWNNTSTIRLSVCSKDAETSSKVCKQMCSYHC